MELHQLQLQEDLCFQHCSGEQQRPRLSEMSTPCSALIVGFAGSKALPAPSAQGSRCRSRFKSCLSACFSVQMQKLRRAKSFGAFISVRVCSGVFSAPLLEICRAHPSPCSGVDLAVCSAGQDLPTCLAAEQSLFSDSSSPQHHTRTQECVLQFLAED